MASRDDQAWVRVSGSKDDQAWVRVSGDFCKFCFNFFLGTLFLTFLVPHLNRLQGRRTQVLILFSGVHTSLYRQGSYMHTIVILILRGVFNQNF